MPQLTENELREIGETAAREFMGAVEEVEVKARVDHAGEPAYFSAIQVERDSDAVRAALRRASVGRKIRDDLLCRGDEAYAFVRVLGRDDWGRRGSLPSA